MTKHQIIAQIANNTGVDREIISNVLEEFFSSVQQSLIKGDSIIIRGFGRFNLKYRAEKKARNIKKGTEMIIGAHYTADFKFSKEVLELVKNSDTNKANIALKLKQNPEDKNDG